MFSIHHTTEVAYVLVITMWGNTGTVWEYIGNQIVLQQQMTEAQCEYLIDEEMWEALDLFAGGFVRELPEGLDTLVGERGQQLSGGECQRLALARAFLSDPVFLVLDEATNALDDDSERIVLNSLKKLTERMTILIVTHKAGLLREADYVIQL